jgi:hypothetical protein
MKRVNEFQSIFQNTIKEFKRTSKDTPIEKANKKNE